MSIKHDRFMKKMGKKYPLASKYLKRNYSEAFPTKQEERDEGVSSSITMQVYPNSGDVPKGDVVHEIWSQFREVAEFSKIDEFKLHFVVKGDDGKQNVVRNVKITEQSFEEYEIEVTADCGQKVVLLFNNKEHYDMTFPVIDEQGYINNIAPEYIGEEPVVVSVQSLIYGDSVE